MGHATRAVNPKFGVKEASQRPRGLPPGAAKRNAPLKRGVVVRGGERRQGVVGAVMPKMNGTVNVSVPVFTCTLPRSAFPGTKAFAVVVLTVQLIL
jgi:hypothetical protein